MGGLLSSIGVSANPTIKSPRSAVGRNVENRVSEKPRQNASIQIVIFHKLNTFVAQLIKSFVS